MQICHHAFGLTCKISQFEKAVILSGIFFFFWLLKNTTGTLTAALERLNSNLPRILSYYAFV